MVLYRNAVAGGDIVIRPARPEELQAVSSLLERAWAEHFTGEVEPERETYRHSVPDVWERLHDSELLVAELDGDIAGTVTYYGANPGESTGEGWPQGWASFRLLGVDPVFRGRGVGRVLAEWCIARALAEGAPAIGLHTSDLMKVARAMYERIGFVRMPEMDFYPRPDFVVEAYRLSLR